jgi:hypothetical protein
MNSPGSDMLLDAARTVAERGRVYGDMRANMERTAQLWSTVLGASVTPEQVALCLIQLKVARLLVTPDHADSALDIAGYAAVLRECQAAKP